MKTAYLPPCCSPLNDHWPLPHKLPAVQLISTTFKPELLDATDFTHCGVEPVRGVPKRQAEYLAGRLCAREALMRLTGTAAVPASGEDRAPQWPTGTLGSITHSSGWAAAIVTNSKEWSGLGLDIEQIMPVSRAERLLTEILTPAEQLRLASLPTEQRAQRISLTFSLKESLFKALYPLVLRRFYFHDAELLSVTADNKVRMRLLIDLHADWPAGSELEGQFAEFEGYLLSLVSIAR